jgi:hypothetical protein
VEDPATLQQKASVPLLASLRQKCDIRRKGSLDAPFIYNLNGKTTTFLGKTTVFYISVPKKVLNAEIPALKTRRCSLKKLSSWK